MKGKKKQVLPERKVKFAEPLLGSNNNSSIIDLEAAKYSTSALHAEPVSASLDTKVSLIVMKQKSKICSLERMSSLSKI